MNLLNGMRFTSVSGERYQLNIDPILKKTFDKNSINILNINTGETEQLDFGEFKSLKIDDDYMFIKFKADIIIATGNNISSCDLYMNRYDGTVYTKDGTIKQEWVDSIIIINENGAVYKDDPVIDTLKRISYYKKHTLNEICYIDNKTYVTDCITRKSIELFDINNHKGPTVHSYDDIIMDENAKNVHIGYAYMMYGLTNVLYVDTDILGADEFYFVPINTNHLIKISGEIVFPISETLLSIPVRNMQDIPTVAKLCINHFSQWSYDYKYMIPAINYTFR